MFRIYPVYIAGFLIVVCSIWVLDWLIGTAFPYSLVQIASYFGVLTRGFFGFSRTDGISWTLEIQIYFYLVVACFGHRSAFFGMIEYLIIATLLAVISACCMLDLSAPYEEFIGLQVGVSLLLVHGPRAMMRQEGGASHSIRMVLKRSSKARPHRTADLNRLGRI